MPLETFVHGALCVAYSGQCLTSESLGGRSANRGECAQACRMTYDLVADGKDVDLGNRAYLLSPQDLSGLPVIPELVSAGVTSLKIEGRLKTPEYVANVVRVYRQALDKVVLELPNRKRALATDLKLRKTKATYQPSDEERYSLEMAFSRGLSTEWLQGSDNQALVHARFGKKRGAYIGRISRIQKGKRESYLVLEAEVPVKLGDGVVIDSGNPDSEQGGRLYAIERKGKEIFVSFGRRDVDMARVRVGDRLWKTSDPELDKEIRQTYAGDVPKFKRAIAIAVSGSWGEGVRAIAQDESGHRVEAVTDVLLVAAHSKPLTTERLAQQFSRLGNTPFELSELKNNLVGEVMVPVSALNQLRRDLIARLLEVRSQPKSWTSNPHASHRDLLPEAQTPKMMEPSLIALVRSPAQIQAALESDIHTLYCELEDPIRYQQMVQQVRGFSETAEIFVAPPRITKPGEYYILEQVKQAKADGYLVRNYDQLAFFEGDRCIGDFSLNVANPIAADYYKKEFLLERLTASYDLNVQQLEDLLESAPPDWFDLTIHQHMPMFHMEHCVFCAFLSEGTDFTNCRRPCDRHEVKLRDRTGTEHVLQADAGCRNTVFNGVAQTGAEFMTRLINKGARHFRVEFLNENAQQVKQTLAAYQRLLKGEMSGGELWRSLNLSNQMGVTRGSLETR